MANGQILRWRFVSSISYHSAAVRPLGGSGEWLIKEA
jgi:hypothetical protein